MEKIQKIVGALRRAVQDYDMIHVGDRIAVGISGGKDSLTMLEALWMLREHIGPDFSLVALALDPRFGGADSDYSAVEAYCRELGVPLDIRRTNIGAIIFETRKEHNPCSLCARMRRAMLHDAAKEDGCNKLALGHNFEDAAETFLMNLLDAGRAECFSPVTYMSRKDITVIRPLIYCREADTLAAAQSLGLPVMKSSCPADKHTEREHMKLLIARLESEEGYESVSRRIVGALQRGAICGWGLDHPEPLVFEGR